MQQEFMRRAIELSRLGMRAGKGGPFGAVIVRGNEIVAEGHNEVFLRKDPTAHAEVVAIRRAAARLDHFRLGRCEIYTSCEPCPMCLGAIYWARIEKIYYANTADDARRMTFDDRDLYLEMSLPRAERRIPARQLLRDQAFAVFREWQEKTDRIDY